jgi:hypothetical protein
MTRRETVNLVILALAISLAAHPGMAADKKESKSSLKLGKTLAAAKQQKSGDMFRAYIGTYTGTGSKGIYVCRFDARSGKLTEPELAAEVGSPSFLAIHPNQKYLYAVTEADEFNGKKSGSVSAFAIDPKTGKLTFLNRQASEGLGPCHLVVDGSGKNVLVANYGGGKHRLPSHWCRRQARRSDQRHSAYGLEREQRAAGSAARALD